MKVAVYCGSKCGNDPAFLQAAKDLGRWIGAGGNTLVYGGATDGLMGAVADAVLEAKQGEQLSDAAPETEEAPAEEVAETAEENTEE